MGAVRCFTISNSSGDCANNRNPSASISTGVSLAKTNRRSSLLTPPGPTTQASTFPAVATVETTTSGVCNNTKFRTPPQYRTIAGVASTAPKEHKMPAPGYCSLPATTPVTPVEYLWSKAAGSKDGGAAMVGSGRTGWCHWYCEGTTRNAVTCGEGRYSAMPISATTTSPQALATV